jgi:hypothetical protein
MRVEQRRRRRHSNEQRRHGRYGNSSVGLAAMVLVAWALRQELRKPAGERTWTGTVAGFVPYDFRRPTLARVRQRLWAPDNPRVIVPRAFGVGWTLNLGRLLRLVRGGQRTA